MRVSKSVSSVHLSESSEREEANFSESVLVLLDDVPAARGACSTAGRRSLGLSERCYDTRSASSLRPPPSVELEPSVNSRLELNGGCSGMDRNVRIVRL